MAAQSLPSDSSDFWRNSPLYSAHRSTGTIKYLYRRLNVFVSVSVSAFREWRAIVRIICYLGCLFSIFPRILALFLLNFHAERVALFAFSTHYKTFHVIRTTSDSNYHYYHSIPETFGSANLFRLNASSPMARLLFEKPWPGRMSVFFYRTQSAQRERVNRMSELKARSLWHFLSKLDKMQNKVNSAHINTCISWVKPALLADFWILFEIFFLCFFLFS